MTYVEGGDCYTARVVNMESSGSEDSGVECGAVFDANYQLEPYVCSPVVRCSSIPLISMQPAVKCALYFPSQPFRFSLTAATHFHRKCLSIESANTEMAAVATLPHPAATHLFTITLDNN